MYNGITKLRKDSDPLDNKEINMNIVNLTPHEIKIMWENTRDMGDDQRCLQKHELVLPASDKPARVTQEVVVTGYISKVNYLPLYSYDFGEVVNLPEPSKGTIYIVSKMVAEAVAENTNRSDVYIVSETIRDASGRIVGCKGLSRLPSNYDRMMVCE